MAAAVSLQDKMVAAGEACAAGDFAAALTLFNEILLDATEESHGLLHFNRGVCFQHLGRHEEAEAALIASVEADPGRAAAWFNLAVNASQRNELELAMERVDKAIAAADEAEDVAQAATAKRLKCSLLKTTGDLVGALELYNSLIEASTDAGEPVVAELYCSRAEVLCRKENWEGAVDDFEACMEAHGALSSEADSTNFAIALLNVAMSHQGAGNIEDAKQRYTECLALKRTPNALNNLAVIHVRAGELSEAESLLREAIALDPSHRNALTALGTCIAQAERYDEAEPLLRRAVAASRDDGDTEAEQVLVAQHAVVCFKLKYLDEAEAGFARLQELDPENVQAANGLMLVRQSRENGQTSVKQPAIAAAPAPAPAPAPAAASASATTSSVGGVRAAAAKFGSKSTPAPKPAAASAGKPKTAAVRDSVHAAIDVAQDGCEGIIATLAELTKTPYPEGVDASKREAYLSRADFEAAFGFDKATFYSKPKWKRKQLKQKLGLF